MTYAATCHASLSIPVPPTFFAPTPGGNLERPSRHWPKKVNRKDVLLFNKDTNAHYLYCSVHLNRHASTYIPNWWFPISALPNCRDFLCLRLLRWGHWPAGRWEWIYRPNRPSDSRSPPASWKTNSAFRSRLVLIHFAAERDRWAGERSVKREECETREDKSEGRASDNTLDLSKI